MRRDHQLQEEEGLAGAEEEPVIGSFPGQNSFDRLYLTMILTVVNDADRTTPASLHPYYGHWSRAKARSQLLVRRMVFFQVLGSSSVALFFFTRAGQVLTVEHCQILE